MKTQPKTQGMEREIERLKRQILRIGVLRPGNLSQQYNVCGKANCSCKADPPVKHGPYYQLSYSRKGKSSTRFIQKHHVATIQKELKNYAKLRELVDRWISASMQISDLKLKASRTRRSKKT